MSDPQTALTLELIRLGQTLRSMRLGRGWTLDDLAERSELSKAYLSRLEAGDRQASIAALLGLSRAYGVPLGIWFNPIDAPIQTSVTPGLISLNIGEPRAINKTRRKMLSGIGKTPINTPIKLSKHGLEGDAQADLERHGGPERAVCVYSLEHYPYWSKRLAKPLGAAAFGENFSVWGMTEDTVCIGDVYRVGSAVVQVSAPRGSCEKLTVRHGTPQLEDWMRTTGYTGFYCRVLEPGEVGSGERLRLLERSEGAPSVAQANRAAM
jgi:MOSC domain-containing protein YiiM